MRKPLDCEHYGSSDPPAAAVDAAFGAPLGLALGVGFGGGPPGRWQPGWRDDAFQPGAAPAQLRCRSVQQRCLVLRILRQPIGTALMSETSMTPIEWSGLSGR